MNVVLTFAVSVCLLSGCAEYVKAAKPPVSPEEIALNDTRASVRDVENALPSYIADEGMAQLERAEIATVQADLAVINRETRAEAFMSEAGKLLADWNVLVARDEILQKRSCYECKALDPESDQETWKFLRRGNASW